MCKCVCRVDLYVDILICSLVLTMIDDIYPVSISIHTTVFSGRVECISIITSTICPTSFYVSYANEINYSTTPGRMMG